MSAIKPALESWRIFVNSRPVHTLDAESEEAAILAGAAINGIAPERVTALPDAFVKRYERDLETKQKKRLPKRCLHEAAHAVIAHDLGAHVLSLSTIPQMIFSGGDDDIDSLGRMAWETPNETPWLPGTAMEIEAKALVLLAGLAAEFKSSGRSAWKARSWEPDLQRAAQLAAEYAVIKRSEPRFVIEAWKDTAGQRVQAAWKQIMRVADALMKHRELRGDDLRKLLEIADKPVDRHNSEATSAEVD